MKCATKRQAVDPPAQVCVAEAYDLHRGTSRNHFPAWAIKRRLGRLGRLGSFLTTAEQM